MKKISIILSLLAATAMTQAAPLSPEEALGRAIADAPQHMIASKGVAKMKLAGTREINGRNAIYLFSGSNGFMAVTADDILPAIAGYSSSPLMDEEGNMAPGMEYWVSELARQVEYAVNHQPATAIPMQTRPSRASIAPLCATKWSQREPYNNLCPKSGSDRTVTGCVATAMSQVMKYHNWPDKGNGSHSYTWNGKQLSLNYSKLSFKWDNMLNEYGDGATTAQNTAVALLMQAAGYSVDMSYSTSGSGAQSTKIGEALGTYFRYDKGLKYIMRDYYYLYEWEDVIYNSIKNYGPVILDGQSNEGGHSFVCDGYDKDGYFHINWGWGGLSDGYFLLDVLNPYTQGVGGSGDGSGFNFMQDAIVDIRPDKNDTSSWGSGMVVMASGLNISMYYDEEDDYNYIRTNSLVYNPGPAEIPFLQFGFRFTPCSDSGVPSGDSSDHCFETSDLAVGYGYRSIYMDPAAFEDGKYLCRLIFRTSENGEFLNIPTPVYDNAEVLVTVENGEFTFDNLNPEIPEFVDYKYPELIAPDTPFKITGTLLNESELPYYSQYTPIFLDEDDNFMMRGESVSFDIEPGQSLGVDYSSHLYKARDAVLYYGDYYMVLCTQTSSYYLPMSDMVKVTMVESLAGVSELTDDAVKGEKYFTLSGIRLSDASRMQPGVPCIRIKDGRALKVITK